MPTVVVTTRFTSVSSRAQWCPPATAATIPDVCESSSSTLGDRHFCYVSVHWRLARRIVVVVVVDELWTPPVRLDTGVLRTFARVSDYYWVTESLSSPRRRDTARWPLSRPLVEFCHLFIKLFVCPESSPILTAHPVSLPDRILDRLSLWHNAFAWMVFLKNRQSVAGYQSKYGRQQWSQASRQLA